MKILIIGADGQLGTDLTKVIPKNEQIPLTINDIDVLNREQTLQAIKKYSSDIVINATAYSNVDKAEDDAKGAFALNSDAVKNIADACGKIDAAMVHISSDYVFDGGKSSPYVESDSPNPLSEYGKSKLAGEKAVKNTLKKYFIIRTTGLYGEAGCWGKGRTNFVETMIKLAESKPELRVVADEIMSPTYTLDLAKKIYELVQAKHYGLYHIVNHGGCSWHDFAAKIFELLGRKVTIHETTAAEFKTKAKRPKYSVLKNAKLAELGMDDMRPWQEALKAYLKEKKYI